MLRIDETSRTLVAPEPPSFVPEPPLARDELHALLTSGWELFAAEIGQPHLRFLAAEPAAGLDMLAFDATAGHVAVVLVADAVTPECLGRALAAAAEVAGWDAARLAAVHEDLTAAVPHETPRIVLVASDVDAPALAVMDLLVRRHGVDLGAHLVRMLRFGAERLMDVARAYPAPDPAAPAAAATPDFFAAVAQSLPAPVPGVAGEGAASSAPPAVPGATHSAPPPGLPA